MERQSFHIVLDESPETRQKLCLSTKFSHKEIRQNYGIFHSDVPHIRDMEKIWVIHIITGTHSLSLFGREFGRIYAEN